MKSGLGDRSLRTEGPTDIRIDDPRLIGIDAELFGNAVLQAIDVLRRFIDRQLIAVPDTARVANFVASRRSAHVG